jgi:hypothetical protein
MRVASGAGATSGCGTDGATLLAALPVAVAEAVSGAASHPARTATATKATAKAAPDEYRFMLSPLR